MPQKESKSERNKRFAKIWSLSRSDAGKTQEYMASGLGVSKKTIQNWEKGVSAPDLYEGSEWFRVLGSNPMPYYLAFLYPWLFDGITPEDDDQDIEQALLENPGLFKTPIVRNGKKATVGYQPDVWKEWE